MESKEFYDFLHRRIAQVSVGSSSLRNQGATGVLETCRDYFENCIKLDRLIEVIPIELRFSNYLNTHTLALCKCFKPKARHFGTARKALNLFFRDVVYNKFLSEYYSIPQVSDEFKVFAQYMEVPLDKSVALGIQKDYSEALPKWNGIIHLKSTESIKYQDAALVIASQKEIPRIHLDLEYYRSSTN